MKKSENEVFNKDIIKNKNKNIIKICNRMWS